MKTTRVKRHEVEYSTPPQSPRQRRFLLIVVRAIMLYMAGGVCAGAQVPCGSQRLICLIPTALHTTASTFNFFNTAFGTQIAQLPLPSKASAIVYELRGGVYVQSDKSLGPVLTERAETIGARQAYFSFTYQHFAFSKIDGNDLKNGSNKLPILFYYPAEPPNTQVVTQTYTTLATTVHQYVGLGTFGITDKLDVSVAVPFARVSMGLSSQGTEYSTSSAATATFSEYLPGAAAGVEDLVFQTKYALIKRSPYNLSVGGEVRFPTGDAGNFLGTGAYGLKPFVVFSRSANLTPHVILGYQWNSHSMLNTGQNGHQNLLPGSLNYAAGFDIRAARRVTVVGDFLGQLFFDAPQVSTPQTVTLTPPPPAHPDSFTTIEQQSGSYNAMSFAAGFKANPWNKLLITLNADFKLNDSGLRATVVPLAGVSYSF